jgi:hypothetical protein
LQPWTSEHVSEGAKQKCVTYVTFLSRIVWIFLIIEIYIECEHISVLEWASHNRMKDGRSEWCREGRPRMRDNYSFRSYKAAKAEFGQLHRLYVAKFL